jgi:multiple sugar transport system permease protein
MTATPLPETSALARLRLFWARHKWSYFFIAPSATLFAIFIALPLARAVLLSFQDVGLRRSEYVGLENFAFLIDSDLFHKALANTFIYAFFVVTCWTSASFAVAVMLQPFNNAVRAVFRGAFYLPYVTSVVVLSLVWLWIFQPDFGFLNYLLSLFGIPRVLWLQHPDSALWSIILSTVLIVPGTGVVIYSAALGSIPAEYYDAAEVEGANAFDRLRYITFPLLRPTTLYLVVIYTIAGFQIFERVYIMTGGGPVNSTTTLVQLIYRTAFADFNYGRASAIALVLFVIVAAFSFLQFRVLNSEEEY